MLLHVHTQPTIASAYDLFRFFPFFFSLSIYSAYTCTSCTCTCTGTFTVDGNDKTTNPKPVNWAEVQRVNAKVPTATPLCRCGVSSGLPASQPGLGGGTGHCIPHTWHTDGRPSSYAHSWQGLKTRVHVWGWQWEQRRPFHMHRYAHMCMYMHICSSANLFNYSCWILCPILTCTVGICSDNIGIHTCMYSCTDTCITIRAEDQMHSHTQCYT